MFHAKHLLLSLTVLFACRQDEPPDLAQISEDYCAIAQPCEINEPWGDQEACEAYSAEQYETTRATDKPCFDARIVMETCIGAFGSCAEYDRFESGKDGDCMHEFMDFYVACLLRP